MSDIRYVCLSDMHLGAANSLLTNLKTASSDTDPSAPSPVLLKLVECLRELIERNADPDTRPTLILNGDILEFALAEDNDAVMCFERFIDLILPQGKKGLFDRILYIPGNHDHHLWETARETQYADFLSQNPIAAWGSTKIPPPWHVTNLFGFPEKLLRSFFLTSFLQRRQDLKASGRIIETAYPNLGLKREDGKKIVLFHHGHFTEDMYLLMSRLRMILFPKGPGLPEDIWGWEEENFAWIDFFWSTLGRSGAVGKGVGSIYEKLQDDRQVKMLLDNLAAGLAKKFGLPLVPDSLEAGLIDAALGKLVEQIRSLERTKPGVSLSDESQKGLWRFLEGPLGTQIRNELAVEEISRDVSFVFGHTHKPFEQDMNFEGYPGWVHVYNSGGWVVDTVDRQYQHGGSVILLDENLDMAALRMYNERDRVEDYEVQVSEANHPGDEPGEFFSEIAMRIGKNRALWQDFSKTVVRAVSVRAEDLRARINSPCP
ncbi:MAG: metallophosphoesterase [Syntrophobacteraceae bacterium]